MTTFADLGLSDSVLAAVEALGYTEPTPVQAQSIPLALEGRDMIAAAKTGTGKTAAFSLPSLDRLERSDRKKAPTMLVITPTRELAMQIQEVCGTIAKARGLRVANVVGGVKIEPQINRLARGVDVLIATPGRLIDLMNQKAVDLSQVQILVLDEADRMLDMGFSDDIMKIISYMPKERQTIMFSATLPPKIRELAKTILRNPAEVNIAISKPNEAIDQSAYVCYENQKAGIIRELFAQPTESKTIIFSSSKMKVKELAHTLKRMKLNVAPMHSDLEQAQREEVMLAFKNNKVNILVATDIVARGIDIEDIGLVINYDVPHDPEDYIHRIGRTARAAATGSAITFVNEEEQGKFHQIEKFIEREIRKADLPESVGEGPAYAPAENRGRGGRGRGGRSGGGSGRGGRDRAGRKRSGQKPAGEPAAAVAAATGVSADNDHASGRGEGNRGSRDRKRRHRGGRRHRRSGQSGTNGSNGQPAGPTES